MTGDWRRLHNEELHDLVPLTKYHSGDQNESKTGGACSRCERRCAYRVMVEKPERKRLENPRSRWKDNIKINLQRIRCDGVQSIDLVQDKHKWRVLVNTATKMRGISRTAVELLASQK